MSKSLGNVVDPLDIVNEQGTDALRYTLATGTALGMDLNLSLERLGANRNLANKFWNAGEGCYDSLPPPRPAFPPPCLPAPLAGPSSRRVRTALGRRTLQRRVLRPAWVISLRPSGPGALALNAAAPSLPTPRQAHPPEPREARHRRALRPRRCLLPRPGEPRQAAPRRALDRV